MSEIRIASRYAKSLIELAVAQNNLETVFSDIQDIEQVASANHDLLVMLHSPVIKAHSKLEILKTIFKSANPLTLQFLDKVVDAGRENLLTEIANQFIAKYNDRNGIANATVISAMELGNQSIERIRQFIAEKINKKQINLTVKIDPKIIGGLLIQYEDKLLDMSIKNELHKLKQSLN